MNMKNIFKKENLKPVIVLLAICVVVAALLGAVISSELKNEKESLLFAAKTFITQGKE